MLPKADRVLQSNRNSWLRVNTTGLQTSVNNVRLLARATSKLRGFAGINLIQLILHTTVGSNLLLGVADNKDIQAQKRLQLRKWFELCCAGLILSRCT